ncbi:unnamed protein product [Victoria cruziana]
MDDSLEQNKLPELKLDAKQAQGFLSFFRSLPQDPKAVRFFDRRDYYTVHGDNATFVARTYYRTTAVLRQIGSGPDAISSASVSKTMFERISRDILLERTDHTLELYEGSGSNWRLSKVGTPGNIGSFEDVLFANNDMDDSPAIVALSPIFRENECLIGLAYVDLTKRTMGIAEFLDDSQFTNVESALVALGCKECLLPAEFRKAVEAKHLNDALGRCNLLVTERKKAEFRSKDLVPDLGRLVKGSVEPAKDLVANLVHASGALGALLSYVDLLAEESNYNSYTMQHHKLCNYMKLDSAAMRALSVLESKTDANKNFSLFGIINRTCTAGMGKRLLNRWLKQPLVDIGEINYRLDMVQAFVEDAALRLDLRQHLKRISDIERLTHRLERRKASLQHVVKLFQSILRLPYIKGAIERYEGEFSSLLKSKYLDALDYWTDDDHLNKFIALVEAALDFEQLENGEYMISADYDPALLDLKNQIDAVEKQIQILHKQTANELDLPVDKGLKLDKSTQYGHVFRITKKEEPKVRKKLNVSFMVLETRKDGVKFTNTKLKKLGDQYAKILEEYASVQRELVARVVQTTTTFSEIFESVAEILSEMDVLLAFADLATSCPTSYTRPEVTPSDRGDIILIGSRHPCVEAQDGVNFIPNDCLLVRGKSWFQIITGPNMGGKSTFIRQVGINVLMAQVGCFVPCDRASVSIRDCIFARVGAGDCQLRGVSTFMQEMLETASILKGATEKSLVIIDELGRGTSTYDGFGLAWAICEHLVEVTRAPTLFATHFHELTALAHQHDNDVEPQAKSINGVANYHVTAHIDPSSRKLTMLYKVEEGACDQSFGIHVAELANFPEEVVSLAKEKAAELEDFSPISLLSENAKAGDKRKRTFDPDDMAKGAAIAHNFLHKFSEMPLDKMDLKQALEEVGQMRRDLERDAVDNSWLQQFFQKAGI